MEPNATWGRSDWGAIRPQRLAEAGIDSYRADLRNNVRALWGGDWDMSNFVASMTDTVERGVMGAWREGAAQAGVAEDELTPAELDARLAFMWAQWTHIPSFAVAIEAGSRANDGKLAPLNNRVDLWANQYNSAVIRAYAMAGQDLKGVWIYGPTEHCSTCAGLHGKVKRMSYWAAHVLPQNAPNPRLSCGGWRCQCRIEPTDAPMSRGRLPGV